MMKDQISKLLVKNPIYKLSRFSTFRILAPSLQPQRSRGKTFAICFRKMKLYWQCFWFSY